MVSREHRVHQEMAGNNELTVKLMPESIVYEIESRHLLAQGFCMMNYAKFCRLIKF